MEQNPKQAALEQAVQELNMIIRDAVSRPMGFMEVCGTHTMSIFRHGIRSLLPASLELVSGPCCPVCITIQVDIDAMIGLSSRPDVIVVTFGDLLGVPGSRTSLAEAHANGAMVEIVYSPASGLKIALQDPDKQVVFLGAGFETTASVVAATILEAYAKEINNFSVFSRHKVMYLALNALWGDQELCINGLLCPGHVSTIIGAMAYAPLCMAHGIPCVIAGFEPMDILMGIHRLVLQNLREVAMVENVYERAVTWEGNRNANGLMETVFESRG